MSRNNSFDCINPLRCEVVDNYVSTSWKNHLHKYGWVIVNKDNFPALNLPIDEWNSQIRDWITTFGPTSYASDLQDQSEQAEDVEPWLNWQQSDIPGSNRKSGYVSTNAGHTSFMWDARLRVKPVFDDLWRVKNNDYDLVTSFEGFTYCVVQPAENRKCLTFLHPDGVDEIICIRSFISLSDNAQDNSGGIILVDQSHLDYEEYINVEGSHPGRALVSLWKKDPSRFIRPALEPGDVLLFDSKLVMDTFGPSTYERPFIGMWVTMLPDDMIEPDDTDHRVQMFMTKSQSTPWCYGSLMQLSIDSDAYPYAPHQTDIDGNIVVNGQTISKTNYTDAHAQLVIGTKLDSLKHKYQMIKSSKEIKKGRPPGRGRVRR